MLGAEMNPSETAELYWAAVKSGAAFIQNALVPELSVRDYDDSFAVCWAFRLPMSGRRKGLDFLTLGDAQMMLDQADKGRAFAAADPDGCLLRCFGSLGTWV